MHALHPIHSISTHHPLSRRMVLNECRWRSMPDTMPGTPAGHRGERVRGTIRQPADCMTLLWARWPHACPPLPPGHPHPPTRPASMPSQQRFPFTIAPRHRTGKSDLHRPFHLLLPELLLPSLHYLPPAQSPRTPKHLPLSPKR